MAQKTINNYEKICKIKIKLKYFHLSFVAKHKKK